MEQDYPVDARGYATDAEGETYLKIHTGSLRKHRHWGTGPRCVMIGRSVRTSFAELDRWALDQAERAHKAKTGAAA